MNEPSKSDWMALYQAVTTFKQASPWEWLPNEDLFAVESSYDGEVGYCSVLGNGQKEFGLGIFLGDRGLQGYAEVMSGERKPEDFNESVMVPLLSMLFVDRDELQKKDREVISSLSLRFRGKNAWPQFRSQKPGYAPWFLEKEEALFLTVIVQQALVVADEVLKGDLRLLEYGASNPVFTRFFRDGRWQGEWRRVKTPDHSSQVNAESLGPLNEATLQLLRSRTNGLSGCWELDIFVLPVPIKDESGRPYFPVCFLAVDHKLGIILDSNLTGPWLTPAEKRNEVIKILEKTGQLPQEFWVKSQKVKELVRPIADALGIRIQVRSLRLLEEARAGLYNYFSQGNL